VKLITGLLQVYERRRLGTIGGGKGILDVIENAWFQKINFQDLLKRRIEAPFIPELDQTKEVAENFDAYEEIEFTRDGVTQDLITDFGNYFDEF